MTVLILSDPREALLLDLNFIPILNGGLSAVFVWKIFSPRMRDLGCSIASEVSSKRARPLSYNMVATFLRD